MNKIENGKLSFIREIIGCLISPRSSFRSILESPSLLKATALILVIAIVASWASFNYTGKLPTSFFVDQRPGGIVNAEQLRQASMTINAMLGLISIFGTWVIGSALIHGFSSPLGGKGTFKSMLTLAGYASTPLLIQQVLRLADSFTAGQDAVLQLVTGLQISVYPLLNTIANATMNIFTIFRLWSIVLFVVAIRENYKMSTARSIFVAAISFVLIAFLSVLLPLR
jgi:hypothetical protein